MTNLVAGDELRQFIERWEALERERKALMDDQKEVMAEAKSRGYDTAIMREIIKQRATDAEKLAEAEAVLALYKSALGM